ncbi:hypothetical protein [Mycobacterium gordonae]|uniref:hypothetical protein n=1 Tax=Mycobacterium gordonae TaxID=1778 RepID=UPI00114D9734|nr:hypothetical protein [Mycobacterium gordonae]MCV7009485.1 hypothetical protein [Mycobacterium gordonae]
MSYPTPHTVGLHTYSGGGDDGYGNPVPVFTPAKASPGVLYKVVGWVDLFLPSAMERNENMKRVISYLQLFAPDTFPATAYDLIDLNGDPTNQWEVLGEANDYTHGPWWTPGCKVWNLRQVTG